MFRPRIIPVLLLKNGALVKSVRFKNYHYIGDPMNAVKIFNDLRADELIFLDIEASKQGKLIDLELVKEIGEEANMPFSVGGGIRTLEDIEKIIKAGAERVVINSAAYENPTFIQQASDAFGSSTICVCIDVKKKLFGKTTTWINGGTKATNLDPIAVARKMQELGAGEIVVQSIEKDGTMEGYDLELIRKISENVTIPVVALGGAKNEADLIQAYQQGFANGLAAGSMFVYQGSKKGVLINYPDQHSIDFPNRTR